ncbi:hypothetical protein SAMN04489724_0255 [Algoriphagus locisalis]|uniref:Uncharacterized protein n=1 Tax=Algoriphagus locisalis TaxID=305507 RepID=A0A1I7E861_9BACT|nr:hypothetical protein [Algoriphagus locisalis]SFU20156.1 hypothetical protein SAMN04489724_0255 [Algoriphagus locisalis]
MSDLLIIAFSVLLALMMMLPLYISFLKQNKQRNILKDKLRELAPHSQLKKNDFATWRKGYCLALVPEKQQLLYLHLQESSSFFQVIELDQIRLCKPVRVFRELENAEERKQIISKISLVFDQFEEQKKSKELELYDENKSGYLVNEWEVALGWSQKVNDFLKLQKGGF